MNAGVMTIGLRREPSTGWERFGIAAITLLGLLSLAVALHIDDRDRQAVSAHAR